MPSQHHRNAVFASVALLALVSLPHRAFAQVASTGAQAAGPDAAQAAAPTGATRDWLRQQFAAYDARSSAAPVGAPSEIAQSLATWDWLRRTPAVGAEPSLDVQAAFLRDHAGWPGTSAMRRRAEAQATDAAKTSDSAALAFFQRVPPQTSAGQARFALAASGPEAERMARTAWARPGIPQDQEAALMARFGALFTAAEHAARADALIWAGQTSAAGRIVPLLDDEYRALAQARIALRSNAPDAEARVASVPARFRRNAGLTYDRAVWLERNGRLADAEALLAAGDTDPGASAPETWLEKRLAMGRAAMRRDDLQTAYRILANHKAYPPGTDLSALPLSQRIDLSDTEWLAGWIALRKLGRADAAQRHFTEFNRVVTTPISQTRGDYWLGRAEKARGQQAAATSAFERAARHVDYFYGQLATEELGRKPALPMVPRIAISAAEQAKFDAASLTKALKALVAMGDESRTALFVRAVADAADTPVQARAAAELGRKLSRPDLGVWTWKAGRSRGDTSTFDLAYPHLPDAAPIPPRDWVISHAIARQESSFDIAAVSGAGARGLMQLMPGTAKDVASKLGLPYDPARLTRDPVYNVQLGSYYIGLRRDNFQNSMMAIAAYNAGAGNVRKWLAAMGDPRTEADPIDWVEMIPFQETRNYVHRVIENAVIYSLLEPKREGAEPRPSRWLRGN